MTYIAPENSNFDKVVLIVSRGAAGECFQVELEAAFFHDGVDGTFAEFNGQGENLRRHLAQAAVLRFQVVQFPPPRDRRVFCPPAPQLLGIDFDELKLFAMNTFDAVNLASSNTWGLRRALVSVSIYEEETRI